jgi:hypothetical protein
VVGSEECCACAAVILGTCLVNRIGKLISGLGQLLLRAGL